MRRPGDARSSGDLWSGLALSALGVCVIAQARQWSYLTPEGPGPGFFPIWYGVAMVALSAFLVASNLLRRRASDHATSTFPPDPNPLPGPPPARGRETKVPGVSCAGTSDPPRPASAGRGWTPGRARRGQERGGETATALPAQSRGAGFHGHRVARALTAWLAVTASVAASRLLGFVVSFALLTFFLVAVMYRRPLKVAALVAAASALGFYIVFPLALGVDLPVGVLGF